MVVRSQERNMGGLREWQQRTRREVTAERLTADDVWLRFGRKALRRFLISLSLVKWPRVGMIFSRAAARVSRRGSSVRRAILVTYGSRFWTYARPF